MLNRERLDMPLIYQGTVSDGMVVLQPGVCLPEGSIVSVEIITEAVAEEPCDEATMVPQNGVPVFPPSDCGIQPGLELVNRLRDGSL